MKTRAHSTTGTFSEAARLRQSPAGRRLRCAAVALATVATLSGCHCAAPAKEVSPPPPSATPGDTPAATPAETKPSTGLAVDGQSVDYQAGATDLKGYLAVPAQPGKYPGVLLVHEWWGLNGYAQSRARQLAALGYVVLAVDMYGEGKTVETPSEAQALATVVKSSPELAKARFLAARTLLLTNPKLDGQKVGALGYCFGGGVALDMVRFGVPLDAVASFHGTLTTQHPATAGSYKGKILIEAGGADPFVPEADVQALQAEMAAAGAEVTVDVYPGAKHAFTNPEATATGVKFGIPVAYDQKADEGSWQALQAFLKRTWP